MMSIQGLIDQARLRLTYLDQLRGSAATLGDTEQISQIEAKISETQLTLNQLLTLV